MVQVLLGPLESVTSWSQGRQSRKVDPASVSSFRLRRSSTSQILHSSSVLQLALQPHTFLKILHTFPKRDQISCILAGAGARRTSFAVGMLTSPFVTYRSD